MSPSTQDVESPAAGENGAAPEENSETTPLLANDAKNEDVPRKAVIMPLLWIGSFLGALDMTILASCYTEIGSEFHRLNLVAYVSVAYLITNTSSQPLYARLSDIIGRRAALVGANIFFAVGTLICGLAPNIWALVAGRAIAGLGGGGLATLSSIVASDVIPLRDRGTWQGYTNIVWGLGASVGGPLGGLFTDTIGWRWAFYVQVPLSVVAAIAVWLKLHINPKVHEGEGTALERIDYLGSLTLTVTVTLLILGLNLGGNQYDWSDPVIIILLSLAIVFLALFILIEAYYAREPMLPLRLLRVRTPIGVALGNFFQAMVAFSALYNLPLWFNVVRGLNSSEAGARLIPQVVGTSIGSLASGVIMRKTGKYRWLMLLGGFGLMIVGSAGLAIFSTAATPSWVSMLCLGVLGLGYGNGLTTTLIALISAVIVEDQAVATGLTYLFRSTGSVLGISLTQAALQNILKRLLEARISGADADEIISRVRESVGAIKNYPGFRDVIVQAYVEALRACFILTCGFAVLGFFSGMLIREHKLHTTLDRTGE